MSGIGLSLRNVGVEYPARDGDEPFIALSGVHLDVQPGEIVAIVGPSGGGKTTILNVVAGFLAYEGDVSVGGDKPGRRRDLGYMFQREMLLPWRTMLGNVALALELRGVERQQRNEEAAAFLERVGLEGFERSYPYQVSGGMAKRASLAQVLIHKPSLLLLDEPFAALDPFTRASIEQDLLGLVEQSGTTTVFVTHNLQEAIALSDRVVVTSTLPGRVLGDHQIDIPRPRSVLDVQYTPRFAELEQEIWAQLRGQVVAAA
ncbi:ABC transporter ATP-binding protein [Microbacterium sp.]|uniref:ABC transporter ATP-binding protein n=1 Tax=Microbacterium sp. TaxID=51671 RepID=UPI0031FEA3CE|nr:ABC transporter ATP-binding protein [Microbacterium sp.]